jgi:uncharacterized MAPEG superfamily protein
MSIAFWCVLAGGLLPVLVVLIAKADSRLDVRNPRDVHLVQAGLRKRAYGAHLNGHEAFPLFAAAVLIATARGVSPVLLDATALTWLAVRFAYTAAYLLDFARIRPALWTLGVLVAVGIFLLPA